MNCSLNKVFLYNCQVLLLLFFGSLASPANDSLFVFPEPFLWYDFVETGDNVFDKSGNDLNGNIIGSALQQDGMVTLPGLDSTSCIKVDSNDLLRHHTQYTMAFRAGMHKLDTNLNMYLVVTDSVQWFCYNPDDALFKFRSSRKFYNLNYIIEDTVLHHIAVVVDTPLINVYFDSDLVGTIEGKLSPVYFWTQFLGNQWMGIFDEFKFYNRALNAYQIKSVFDADMAKPLPPDTLYGAMITPTSILLNWEPSFDNIGTAGYIIYRDGDSITTTTDTTYIDSMLPPNQNYTYVVRAGDYYGNLSDLSNSATITVCDRPDINPVQSEYLVCTGDSITLATTVTDLGYTYKWNSDIGGILVQLKESDYYNQTTNKDLQINGVHPDSLPRTYLVKVRKTGCETYNSERITVTMNETFSLEGSVKISNRIPLDSGVVLLYRIKEDYNECVDTTLIRNGDYSFPNICAGEYHIKAKPLGTAAQIYAERYFGTSLNNEPGILNLYNDHSHVNIHLVPLWLNVPDDDTINDKINIRCSNHELLIFNNQHEQNNIYIQIYNSQGQLMTSHCFTDGQKNIRINIGHLHPGVYFAIMHSDKKWITTLKFMYSNN